MTLIEVLMVIVLIGVMAGLMFPRIGTSITKQNLRSARNAVVTVHAKARATAIQRASLTTLHLNGNVLAVRSRQPVTGVWEQVGQSEDLYQRYGAVISTARDSLLFDARGLGMETATTTIYVTKGAYVDSVVITSIGRVLN